MRIQHQGESGTVCDHCGALIYNSQTHPDCNSLDSCSECEHKPKEKEVRYVVD